MATLVVTEKVNNVVVQGVGVQGPSGPGGSGTGYPAKLTNQSITAFTDKIFTAVSNILSIKLEKSTGEMVDLPIISKSGGGLSATVNYSETVSNVNIFIYTES